MKRKEKIKFKSEVTKINTEQWLSKLNRWAELRPWWIMGIILSVFILLAGLSFDPKPFVGGDNAAYVSLSKSLVHGNGLAEIWTQGEKPHTLYPFGFPLLLAPISLFNMPYIWYKLIPWISGLIILLVFSFLIKGNNKVLNILPVFLLAVNPYYLEYSHWVLSELPFTLFVVLTFLLLHHWEKRGGYLWLSGVILSAVFANHIRSAGIALYLGIFLYLLFKGKFKESAILIIGCSFLTLPWALRNSRYGTSGGYLDVLMMRDIYQPELGFLGFSGLVQRLFTNVNIYFPFVLPRMLFPSIDDWGLSGVCWVIMLLTVIPATATLIARLIKSPKGYDWFVLAFMGMALIWPEVSSDIRFMLPLLPFLLLYMVQAYQYLISILFKRNGLGPAVAVLLVLSAANVSADWNKIKGNLSVLKNYSLDKYSGYDPAWRSFFTAAEWIKTSTPENSIVVSRKPSLFYLSAQRKAFCYPFTVNRDSVRKEIDRADYVMVEPVSGTGQRYLIPAIQPLLDKKYKIIYAQGDPPTYVLQIIKENPNAR